MNLDLLKIQSLEDYNPILLSEKSIVNYSSIITDIKQKSADEGKLYIIKLSDFLEIEDASKAAGYICINNLNDVDLYRSFDFPILLIDNAPLNEIVDILLEDIFYKKRYEDSKILLIDALERNDGIKDILNIATEIVGNPFYFIDLNYRMIAWSTNININNSYWSNSVKNGIMDDSIPAQCEICGENDEFLNTGNACLMKIVGTDIEKISCNLYIEGKQIGYLGVFNFAKPFSENDMDFVNFVKKIVIARLNKSEFYKSVKGRPEEFFFIDLIKSPLTPEMVNFRKSYLNIKLGKNIIILIVNYINEDKNNVNKQLIKNELSQIIKKCYSVIFEGNIVLIIDLDEEYTVSRHLLEKISSYLSNKKIIGALSNPFSDIYMLKTYYKQAADTIKVAMFRKEAEYLYYYKNHIIDSMLMTCIENGEPQNLEHPAINILKSYDANNGTDYLHSLKVYIECFGNMSMSAKLLNIHYNTMKYRVKVIESVADLSLSDISTFVNIYISYRLYKGFDKVDIDINKVL
ncbi:MAG: PucR family transcriptional regulator [Clostridiaceae bacterium]|nr:PucR family transcriptional regulator [Clostridiaceae bacterium]